VAWFAAESLAKRPGDEHKSGWCLAANVCFYLALVRLAFGHCAPDDIASTLNARQD
jgi:hypothetical protein